MWEEYESNSIQKFVIFQKPSLIFPQKHTRPILPKSNVGGSLENGLHIALS